MQYTNSYHTETAENKIQTENLTVSQRKKRCISYLGTKISITSDSLSKTMHDSTVK